MAGTAAAIVDDADTLALTLALSALLLPPQHPFLQPVPFSFAAEALHDADWPSEWPRSLLGAILFL